MSSQGVQPLSSRMARKIAPYENTSRKFSNPSSPKTILQSPTTKMKENQDQNILGSPKTPQKRELQLNSPLKNSPLKQRSETPKKQLILATHNIDHPDEVVDVDDDDDYVVADGAMFGMTNDDITEAFKPLEISERKEEIDQRAELIRAASQPVISESFKENVAKAKSLSSQSTIDVSDDLPEDFSDRVERRKSFLNRRYSSFKSKIKNETDVAIDIARRQSLIKFSSKNAIEDSVDLNRRQSVEPHMHSPQRGVGRRNSNLFRRKSTGGKLTGVVGVKYIDPIYSPCGQTKFDLTYDEVVGAEFLETLDPMDRKRQMIMYEFIQTEEIFTQDLSTLLNVFLKPAHSLQLFKPAEEEKIFGHIGKIEKLHAKFIDELHCLQVNNYVYNIGETIQNWIMNDLIPNQCMYTEYCSNIWQAKLVIDRRCNEPKVREFMDRCSGLPACRRLRMWDFVDSPRRRMQKYNLLLTRIIDYTPEDHADFSFLTDCVDLLADLLKKLDDTYGEAQQKEERLQIKNLLNFQDKELTLDIWTGGNLIFRSYLKDQKGNDIEMYFFEHFLIWARVHKKIFVVNQSPVYPRELSVSAVVTAPRTPAIRRISLNCNLEPLNAFEVVKSSGSNVRRTLFYANNVHLKNKWVTHLRRMEYSCQAKISTSSTTSSLSSLSED